MTVALRVVAIDGPAGSGKSTVARLVARELGLEVLDTGAMYRAVTFAVLRRGVDLGDEEAVAEAAHRVDLQMAGGRVVVDGVDATEAIRGPEVTGAVSAVSAQPEVRRELVARQRQWATEQGGGVLEGRDIGTVVFPDAPVKIFLTARDDVRVGRRAGDEEAARRPADEGAVRRSVLERDRLDSTRAVAPLRAAGDAVVVDTSDLSVEDVVDEVLSRVREAFGEGS